MGPAPIPIPGLSVLLGGYAMLCKAPAPVPTSLAAADRPSVDAVIPALNEAPNIAYAIASLDRQTLRPDTLTVVDDGSDDGTADVVREMSELVDLDLELVQHEESGGKTRRIKQVTRDSTAGKLFVLDADTYLEDETYLERVLAAHEYGDVGCAFGAVRSDTRARRAAYYERALASLLPRDGPAKRAIEPTANRDRPLRDRVRYRLTRWPVEGYRDVLYDIEQSFSKDSQMRLFGTSLFPAGCGVLYDRDSLRRVFDDFSATLGDNLTNSEDIFIGFAFVDRNLANVQVDDVSMRTTEPSLNRFRRQTYLWGSAFLQSAYYFRAYSGRLRAWTGDITDERGESNGPATDVPDSTADRRAAAERGPPSTGDPELNSTGDPQPAADRYETDGGAPVGTRDRPLDADRSTGPVAERASRADVRSGPAPDEASRRVPVGAAVGAQIVDGLYSVTLCVVALLVLRGAASVEVLVAVLLIEFGIYFLLVGLFSTRNISFGALFVSIPVRLVYLPLGTYVYLRVGLDLVRGNRDWMK